MKKTLRWLGVGIVAIVAFLLDLALNRRKGYEDGKADAETAADIEKVKEAAKRNDTDTIDDMWRK